MEKIYLSDSGPKVSPAIYGFYRWTTEAPDTQASMEKIVNLCLELGINTFDHADIYGSYQCEEIFGNLIQSKSFKREDIVLFTKCGLRLPDANQPGIRVKHYDTSREHILTSVDNSLRKLKTDYIDIFLLDHLDPLSSLEETALTLSTERFRKSKKYRRYQFLCFSTPVARLLFTRSHRNQSYRIKSFEYGCT